MYKNISIDLFSSAYSFDYNSMVIIWKWWSIYLDPISYSTVANPPVHNVLCSNLCVCWPFPELPLAFPRATIGLSQNYHWPFPELPSQCQSINPHKERASRHTRTHAQTDIQLIQGPLKQFTHSNCQCPFPKPLWTPCCPLRPFWGPGLGQFEVGSWYKGQECWATPSGAVALSWPDHWVVIDAYTVEYLGWADWPCWQE